jgi:hypothetical protein
MPTIKVEGDMGTVTIVDVDPDEGIMGWTCTCGQSETDPKDYVYETMADVINAAEVHLDHRCKGSAG